MSLVWCLGDLGGFGPHPDRAASVLRAAGIPTLRGNYDDSIGHARADCACGYTDPRDEAFAQRSYDYTLARTAETHRAWRRALPEQQRLEIAGRRVLLCHGSPRRVNEFLWDSGSAPTRSSPGCARRTRPTSSPAATPGSTGTAGCRAAVTS